MNKFDLELGELERYRPQVAEPSDFDDFWAITLANSRKKARPHVLSEITTPLKTVRVFDLKFSGYDGDPISGWIIAPIKPNRPLPVIVEFVGYSGGRSYPQEHLRWASSDYIHFIMDTRGQGGHGSFGVSPDLDGYGPSASGFMTMGIESPYSYYYRRVFTDAALAVDVAMKLDNADPSHIIVSGMSQGGGIALAAAGLNNSVFACMPDVPFLCDFRRAVGLTGALPYSELVNHLKINRDEVDRTFRTLSYFDGVNFAKRATAPARFSTALMDEVCPPSTVFAAKNWYSGESEIEVFEFNGHEGGGPLTWQGQVRWLEGLLT